MQKKCQLNRPQPYPEPTENIPTEVEGHVIIPITL